MLSLAGYCITSEIYESANSLVYRGFRELDLQPLVFKVLKPNYPTPDELTRYRQEYEITRSLRLEGVIKVYGIETYQNTLVMFLEDFSGESLKHWLRERSLSLEEVLTLGMQLTEILGQVHQQQVIHKDINPANIVWNPATGQLKLIDFGIASRITRETPTLRSPHVLEGTLAYMSPEQTGRMNRSIDYRTDFYSLGATLYELLTQQFPFTAKDALELVHCHLAKRPVAPSDRISTIPRPVSDIVMKLLAKAAEDRYQSCRGIQQDLEICLSQLQTTQQIAAFPLAQQDSSDIFQIPQKLYGRDQEVETLLAAFARVSGGKEKNSTALHSELMLISGYSGIGKTLLVQEIYKPITQQRGYFIRGKFDQYQRDIPYSAFFSAFSGWVEQLLTESEAQLNQWKVQLLAALEPNAQVLVDVIPELEFVIGKQPPVSELPPTESRNRFNRVFQQFIQVLAQSEHPLAIFLDDLQWVDAASLQLIQVLMTTEVPFLFLIGAYRDNEVSATHPLMQTIEEMQKAGTTIHAIALSPLQKADLQHLLTDTLHRSEEEVAPLADLLLAKTDGNPFFVNEFLRALYVEQLLTFDYQHSRWEWSIADIQDHNMTDNVVELLITKIQRLQPSTQDGLRHAACIGNQFDLQTLTFVLDAAGVLQQPDAAEAIALLKEAVNVGLIMPLNDSYKRIELGIPQPGDVLRMEYKFTHDRIQQAAYSLNSDTERLLIHRQIGQHLLQMSAQQQSPKLFDMVNHLNLSRVLIETQSEQEELARFNLVAAEKAIASTAYEAALRYLDAGLKLLSADSWQNQYNLTLALHIETVFAEYLNANFEAALLLAEVVIKQARNSLDKAKVYETKLQIYITQSQLVEALDTGLSVLEMLGVSLEKEPPNVPEIEALIYLSEMTDPEKLAAMQILITLVMATFYANPALFPQIVFTMVHLSLRFGNSASSAYGYVAYAWMLCRHLDIEPGYRYGELALRVLGKFKADSLKCQISFMHNSYVRPWKEHHKEIIEPLVKSVQDGLETGGIEYAGYCSMSYCQTLFFVGENIATVVHKSGQYIELMQKLNHSYAKNYLQIYQQLGLNLAREASAKSQLTGTAFNEDEMVPIFREAKHSTMLGNIYLAKTILSYLFRESSLAVENAKATDQCAASMIGSINHAEHIFYYSLALLDRYPHVKPDEQQEYLTQVLRNQERMQQWANHAPCNFQHKYDFVEAEKARVTGQIYLAMGLYDRAAELAKEHDYIHEQALILEKMALFYLETNRMIIARAYLEEARYCYLKWGATAKVKDLENRHSELLRQTSVSHPHLSLTTTDTSDSETLDLATVIKAAQTFSGELNLEKLLTQLITLVLQNAGAQTGTLLLESDHQLCIAATGTVDSAIVVQQLIPLADTDQLPISLIQYVARKQKTVVLADAVRESRFASDRYIQSHQPKSLLCTPIQGHGKLIGILYLENNLTTNAFTPDRATILQVLAAQAAIALENARLYEQLETYSQTLEINNLALQQEVSDRTRAEMQLRHSLSEREVLLKEIHHRVKNNLQIISGLLQLQAQSITDTSTINILRESQYRIESMSLIHKKLYASTDFGEIDLSDYIPSLASNLLASYQITPGYVTLQMEIAPVLLNIDQAIPCGLIVNELVSNALKYAFPGDLQGEIKIELQTSLGNQVHLTIQDNGIGLPESVNWQYAQSLGLSLVHDLVVEQLEGSLAVEREGGTTFRIQFPQASLFNSRLVVEEK